MKQGIFEIAENLALAPVLTRMVLQGDTREVRNPGQFVEIEVPEFFLRRPFSVCDVEGDRLTIIYKTAGRGTEAMRRLPVGGEVNVLTGLGNGFSVEKSGKSPLLVGGGSGIPPFYMLSKVLTRQGITPTVVLGFNRAIEVFFEQEFRELGCKVIVATADGSYGERGLVTDVMLGLDYSFVYSCGPIPMLRAVDAIAKTGAEYSFEARMGCGFGACMGCSMETKSGPKRVCHDGPVFSREEIIWTQE